MRTGHRWHRLRSAIAAAAIALAIGGCGDGSDGNDESGVSLSEPPPPSKGAVFCEYHLPDLQKPTILPIRGEAFMGKGTFLETQQPFVIPTYPNGVCSDVTSIQFQGFPNGNQFSLAGTGPDTIARLFEGRNFRGHRLNLQKPFTGEFCDFSFFVGPEEPIPYDYCNGYRIIVGRAGSLVMEVGQPAANREQLLRTRNCDHCNLQGVDLQGLDLTGASLRGADLSRANLRGTILKQAPAERALFNSALLSGANLEGAFLKQAVFEGDGPLPFDLGFYPPADLSPDGERRTNLKGADLTEAQMAQVVLEKADLMGAHLPGADLRKAKLSEANLTDAKLPGAILTEVVGDGAIFTNATLSGVNLQGGVLSGAFLDGA